MTMKRLKEISKILLDRKLVQGDAAVIPEAILYAVDRIELGDNFSPDNVMRPIYYHALRDLFFDTLTGKISMKKFYDVGGDTGLTPKDFKDYVIEVASIIGFDGERDRVRLA